MSASATIWKLCVVEVRDMFVVTPRVEFYAQTCNCQFGSGSPIVAPRRWLQLSTCRFVAATYRRAEWLFAARTRLWIA